MVITSRILLEDDINEELDAGMRQILADCYQGDKEVFRHRRIFNGHIPAYTVALLDDGVVCGHAAVVDTTIRVGQSTYRVAGLGYLCVAEQSRGHDLGRRMADIAMREAVRLNKFDFGLLYTVGTLPKLYSTLGWKLIDEEFFLPRRKLPKTTYPNHFENVLSIKKNNFSNRRCSFAAKVLVDIQYLRHE